MLERIYKPHYDYQNFSPSHNLVLEKCLQLLIWDTFSNIEVVQNTDLRI